MQPTQSDNHCIMADPDADTKDSIPVTPEQTEERIQDIVQQTTAPALANQGHHGRLGAGNTLVTPSTRESVDMYDDVCQFMQAARQPMMSIPVLIGTRNHQPIYRDCAEELSDKLIAEEYLEYQYALSGSAEEIDALIDLIYVIMNKFRHMGIDPRPLWRAVHQANMTKAGGPKDPITGKQLKPPGFKHPDIAALIEEQRVGPATSPGGVSR